MATDLKALMVAGKFLEGCKRSFELLSPDEKAALIKAAKSLLVSLLETSVKEKDES